MYAATEMVGTFGWSRRPLNSGILNYTPRTFFRQTKTTHHCRCALEVSAVNVRDAGEIERAVSGFARSPNGGLIEWRAHWRGFIAS
jgi:hypothetical protein